MKYPGFHSIPILWSDAAGNIKTVSRMQNMLLGHQCHQSHHAEVVSIVKKRIRVKEYKNEGLSEMIRYRRRRI